MRGMQTVKNRLDSHVETTLGIISEGELDSGDSTVLRIQDIESDGDPDDQVFVGAKYRVEESGV